MNRRSILLSAAAVGAGAALARPRIAAAAPTRARRQVLAKDGVSLFHREFGEGPRTLLFAASWALDGRMWDYQVAHFAALGYRCITWDRRGHGRSEIAASAYDMDTLADDLGAVIEQLDLRDVVLVGHSMGAAECLRYLARSGGQRVRKAALIAPVAPFVLRTPDNPYGAPLAFYESVWAQFATDFPKWAYDNQAAFFVALASRPLQEALTRQLLETPVSVAIATQRTLVTTDLRTDLPKIRCPVMILHGDKDASAPLAITGRRLAAGMPHAVLKVYAGAPHGIWITHLAQVNGDLEAFLAT